MKFSVTRVLQAESDRLSKPKPLPTVKIKQQAAVPFSQVTAEGPKHTSVADTLALDLANELATARKERDKLSTRAVHLVNEIEQRLRSESPVMAEAFLQGELPMPELANAYAAIQTASDTLLAIYDRIEHVRQVGVLPDESPGAATSQDLSALRGQLYRLKDNIYKARTKLATKSPKNPLRKAMWAEEIARLEAEREDLKLRIKRLTDGEREK